MFIPKDSEYNDDEKLNNLPGLQDRNEIDDSNLEDKGKSAPKWLSNLSKTQYLLSRLQFRLHYDWP